MTLRVIRATDPLEQDVTYRILKASCPRCCEHIQFALNDEDYIHDEVKYLELRVTDLLKELNRKEGVIRKLADVPQVGDKK